MMQHFSMGSFVTGVMFGALLAAAWFFDGNIDALFPSPPLFPTTNESAIPESGAVSVTDQPSGENVVVESVTVPPPGVWIAVRETNGRDLGNILGAARVVGPHSLVVIPLLRATEPSRLYAIQLYRDDNEGAFDPSNNSVYVDFDTGTRVIAYFTTTE